MSMLQAFATLLVLDLALAGIEKPGYVAALGVRSSWDIVSQARGKSKLAKVRHRSP